MILRLKRALVPNDLTHDTLAMVALPIALAPVIMAIAILAGRRLGPSAGGWVAALPIAFAVAVAAVDRDQGTTAAGAMALSAASHVPAQIAYGAVFALLLRRGGLARALTAGLVVYAASSLLIAQVPWAVSVACALPLLAAAPRLMAGDGSPAASSRGPHIASALTCGGAGLIVAAAVMVSHLAGPVAAGAVAAFPTMCTLLTITVVRHDGAAAGSHALIGLARSLPCYLAFCLSVALLSPFAGLAALLGAAIPCLALAGVTWRGLPIAPRPETA
jgi:hypothetical protein